MEEKKRNWTLWIIVAAIAGLLMGCAVGALSGGLVGYGVGQRAASRAWMMPGEGFNFRFETPQVEPRIPEIGPLFRRGGALITDVVEGSPAAKAGLRAGDVITAIDDSALPDDGDLAPRLSRYDPGDEISLTIVRNGRERTVEVTLGRNPDKGGETPWLGIYYQSQPLRDLDMD